MVAVVVVGESFSPLRLWVVESRRESFVWSTAEKLWCSLQYHQIEIKENCSKIPGLKEVFFSKEKKEERQHIKEEKKTFQDCPVMCSRPVLCIVLNCIWPILQWICQWKPGKDISLSLQNRQKQHFWILFNFYTKTIHYFTLFRYIFVMHK